MQTFKSKFSIGEEVDYVSSRRIIESELAIKAAPEVGTVTSVRFTKGKVFYSILSDYDGDVNSEIPSDNVAKKTKTPKGK